MKKISIFFLLYGYLVFSQQYEKYTGKETLLSKSYFNLTGEQRKSAELYLVALSQIGNTTRFPKFVGMRKDGEIISFERYKSLYEDCIHEKCIWNTNLLQMTSNRYKNRVNIICAVLEPSWKEVDEIKYEEALRDARSMAELEEIKKEFRRIRDVRSVRKFKKYNQKYNLIFFNDYGK